MKADAIPPHYFRITFSSLCPLVSRAFESSTNGSFDDAVKGLCVLVKAVTWLSLRQDAQSQEMLVVASSRFRSHPIYRWFQQNTPDKTQGIESIEDPAQAAMLLLSGLAKLIFAAKVPKPEPTSSKPNQERETIKKRAQNLRRDLNLGKIPLTHDRASQLYALLDDVITALSIPPPDHRFDPSLLAVAAMVDRCGLGASPTVLVRIVEDLTECDDTTARRYLERGRREVNTESG